MPRCARKKHNEAIYHVMVRGNNREKIFFSDDDKVRYLETLKRYKEKFKIKIYAYCLMDNHVHLIIEVNGQDISKVMKGISLSYTLYVNRTYQRCGHLFQDRFKSYIVDSDNYVLEATRYILQNPVRANMVENPQEYKWSSINIYIGQKDVYGIIDKDFILDYFSSQRQRARELFVQFVNKESKIKISEVEYNKYENSDKKVNVEGISAESIIEKISTCFGVCKNDVVTKYTKRFAQIKQIAAYLISLKSKLTHREIGQIFGITGSGVGQKIKKAVELVREENEMKKYFELILQI